MDGIGRGRLVIPSRILAPWKALWRKRFFLVDGSQIEKNYTEYYPNHIQIVMEKKEMIPSGWISQREAVNTQYHHGLVEDNMKEKEMIPGEWN